MRSTSRLPQPPQVNQGGYRGTGMEQVVNPRIESVKLAANQAPAPLEPAEEGGPKASQVYQNVQVLGDLSVAQFNRLMVAMTAWVSPEQGCAYCHNVQNFADDGLYTKLVARRMTQMTQTINEEQFLLAVKKYQVAKEFLKEEQGRYVIAQAELDSLENRLRELDEAARELEASSTETKEELKIIEKKQNDLKSKKEDLRTQIDDSTKKIEELVVEIELSTQMRERVLRMKSELLKAEERIGTTMVEIDRLNDQYFTMKKKYDALDVEFAQLFQQFSERK